MRKKNSFMKFIITLLFIGAIAGAGFLYLSPQFEQNKPEISFSSNKYWNLKDKLNINIKDESSIRYYKITFIDGSNNIVLDEKIIKNNTNTNQTISISPPKLDIFYKGDNVKIKVEAVDNSKWNFLNGNEISKTFDILVDKEKPVATVVNNSMYIKRGGSAVVIVKVEDKNLVKSYISFNNKYKFKLIPFYKENYFIALIAWDINIEEFVRVNLVATDKAGNITKTKVPLYVQNFIYKKDKIKITDRFIENISENVLNKSAYEIPSNNKDKFIKQNSELRKNNIEFLRKLSLEKMDYSKVTSFNIKAFKRLTGSKRVASYAERRSYLYKNEKIDEQWHLGLDWAKYKHSKIKSSNEGKVIYNSYLGIYGNTVIIDHGLGLATLYAHLSLSNVNIGDDVYNNTKLGNTGASGAALGDHLHFGVLIQGIEVDPREWMDKKWLKNRIINVIKSAKKSINKK